MGTLLLVMPTHCGGQPEDPETRSAIRVLQHVRGSHWTRDSSEDQTAE